MMGSTNGESDERPVHRVRISRDFEMGKYEVTQAQWEAVRGNNPSFFKGADLPVETVSWDEAQEFISKLNQSDSKYQYRLPTEGEEHHRRRSFQDEFRALCRKYEVEYDEQYVWD